MIKKRNKELAPDTIAKCAVCGAPILVFAFNGWSAVPCEKCGWIQEKCYLENPDKIYAQNLVSLNRARKLYKANKPFTPDFGDFIEMLEHYGEVEFTYKGTRYGVVKQGEIGIEMYVMHGKEWQDFETIKDFETKASINGALLKTIWSDVTDADWMQM